GSGPASAAASPTPCRPRSPAARRPAPTAPRRASPGGTRRRRRWGRSPWCSPCSARPCSITTRPTRRWRTSTPSSAPSWLAPPPPARPRPAAPPHQPRRPPTTAPPPASLNRLGLAVAPPPPAPPRPGLAPAPSVLPDPGALEQLLPNRLFALPAVEPSVFHRA